MSKTKTVILVESVVMSRTQALVFDKTTIAIPVTRIARVDPQGGHDGRVVNPPKSKLTLRTPEDHVYSSETVEAIAAKMNGEG